MATTQQLKQAYRTLSYILKSYGTSHYTMVKCHSKILNTKVKSLYVAMLLMYNIWLDRYLLPLNTPSVYMP